MEREMGCNSAKVFHIVYECESRVYVCKFDGKGCRKVKGMKDKVEGYREK